MGRAVAAGLVWLLCGGVALAEPADENLSSIMLIGSYRQAAVIDYNRPKPVPGHGSAIFFHVGGRTPTAGCVAIEESVLVGILRSLAPGDRIVMGPRSEIFRA